MLDVLKIKDVVDDNLNIARLMKPNPNTVENIAGNKGGKAALF